MDSATSRARAQVDAFRALLKKRGLKLTRTTEKKMLAFGVLHIPKKPIETTRQGVAHLTMLYGLATKQRKEARAKKARAKRR